MKRLAFLGLCSLLCAVVSAQQRMDVQQLILEEAPTASYAVLPVTAWVDHDVPGQEVSEVGMAVIGTAFVVNNAGDFITAAHVASTTEIGAGNSKVKFRLTVGLRQKRAAAVSVPFKVIEIDTEHDLALCHLDLRGVTFAETRLRQIAHPEQPGGFTAEEMSQPFASLAVEQRAPRTGHFVLVSGFPLGSWTPTIQFGLLSTTTTVYPTAPIARLLKDTGELLLISVSGNHGNSGGPVIDLVSGRVVGVILSVVPAPLALGGQQIWSNQTFDMSGIMLAAPAKWVNALLSRHGVRNEGIKEGRLFWGAKRER